MQQSIPRPIPQRIPRPQKSQARKTHRPATAAAVKFSKEPLTEKGNREQVVDQMKQRVETRLVAAAWTLRRTPDRERGFLHMRTMMWPDAAAEAGTYASQDMTALQARRSVRLSPQEIDQMQPALDLLQLLPDTVDRKLVFWACWHQDGEVQVKIPWAKVRRSLDSTQSRWTMKRRYDNGLRWLASIILAQE